MTTATLAADKPLLFFSLLKSRERQRAISTVPKWGLFFLVLVLAGWTTSFAVGFPGAVTLLTLAAFAAAIFGFWHATVGIMGIGMLCTLDAVTRHYLMSGGVLRWNSFNYWLFLVLLLYSVRLLSVRYLPMRLLLIFSGVLTLQLLYSPNRFSGVQHWLGIVTSLSLFVYFMRAAKDPRIWPWLGIVSGALAGVGGLIFNLHKQSLPPINPNALVYFPLTGLFAICMAFKFARGRSSMQLTLQVLALLNVGWVFLTGSRGGMLMGACCLLYLLLASGSVRLFAGMIVLSMIVGFVVSTRFAESENYSMQRIKKLFSSEHSWAERTSGRSELVLAGWYMFLKYPWGIGTGGFSSKYAEVSDKNFLTYGMGYEKAAHSGWIKTLAENGVVGIVLFAGFVFSFAYVGWKRRRLGVFSLGLLVTFVLATALISTEFQGKAIWFLMAGSLVILYRGYPIRVPIPKSGQARRQRATRTVDPRSSNDGRVQA
jgi:O-antigen ligase